MQRNSEHPVSFHPTLRHQPDQVYLRVYTFGPFHIEWVDPVTGQTQPLPAERLCRRGAAPSLALLKALLGQPDRFATRSWLCEQFWPDSTNRQAKDRLNDVASLLRGLLRPEGNTAKVLHAVYGTNGEGAGYQLETYPFLWCDADAFLWYVEHATLLDRMGQDSTTCWEHAYALAMRGMYLPAHIYEDWARLRQQTLEGVLRDCVQRWSYLLRQMGHLDEAIRRLRRYWEEHPTDEDALRMLLDMLGERGRYQEAEACYAQTEAVLKEDGDEPDPRTREMREYVRALPISQRQAATATTGILKRFSAAPILLSALQEETVPYLLSQAIVRGIIQAVREWEQTSHLHTATSQERHPGGENALQLVE